MIVHVLMKVHSSEKCYIVIGKIVFLSCLI